MMEVLLEKSDPVIRHLLLVILDRFRNRNDSSATIHPQIVEDSDHSRLRKAVKGEATLRLSLAHGMSRALTHDEFQLHYQPICNLADGKIAGFEALIRWAHPTDGVLPPKDFLWIAEQTGLIHDIGLWTLDRACRDWPMLNKITKHQSSFVSVNISASQLKKERLVEEVAEIIARHKMDPAHLKLELTETVMVDRPEDALIAMHRLIDLGCSFALDDFGSGHSGLRQLQQYPLNTIKIDGDIVAPILESPQSYEIVRSSVALAHSLGMRVVAESIETEEVRNKLIEMKCDLGQGWHFGKSATLADLAMGYGYA
jgi:EAL domain-containing protein (putative c-di-GMP-specific phosphodiesterase class I)